MRSGVRKAKDARTGFNFLFRLSDNFEKNYIMLFPGTARKPIDSAA